MWPPPRWTLASPRLSRNGHLRPLLKVIIFCIQHQSVFIGLLSSGPYYQVNGGDTDWSGFELSGKCELPDRKYSVPAFNEASVKLRDRKDNVPSRPSSLIESSEQKDLKIFEIGNLGDSNRLLLSGCTSQSSSQADLLDTNSVASDTPKSPLPSSSSREILDVFSNRYYLSRVFIQRDHNDGLKLWSPFHVHLFL